MNGIKVSEKIFLNHNSEVVWKIISSKNALELFHPYCLKNDAIDYKKKRQASLFERVNIYPRIFRLETK